MDRNRIVLLLYVLTFLMSVYLKFVDPNRLDPHNTQELFRENNVMDIGGMANDFLQYSWTTEQSDAEFEYRLARQIGDTLSFTSANFEQGAGRYQINYSQTSNNFDVQYMGPSQDSNVYIQFDSGNYYFVHIIEKDGFSKRIVKKQDRNFGYLLDQGIKLLIFSEIPLNKDGSALTINYKYLRRGNDVLPDSSMIKSVEINLADSTWQEFDAGNLASTFGIDKFTFAVKYLIPDSLHGARGNYLDVITEKKRKRLNLNNPGQEPNVFTVSEEIVNKFKILHPPENYVEKLNTPVGMPFKQVISANFPVEYITLYIDNKEVLNNESITNIQLGNREALKNSIFVTPTNNYQVFDLEFPITTNRNLNGFSSLQVPIRLVARSGMSVDERNWLIEVIPFRFQVWPPIRPMFQSELDDPGNQFTDEKELFERFIKKYPDEESYIKDSPANQAKYPIVYESRPVNFFYSLQNVNANHIRNCVVNGNQSPRNQLGNVKYSIDADVRNLNLRVNTNTNHYKQIQFYVAQVPDDYRINIKDNDYVASTTFVTFYLHDFFGDPIKSILEFNVRPFKATYANPATSETQFVFNTKFSPGSIVNIDGLRVNVPYSKQPISLNSQNRQLIIRQLGVD